MPSTAGLLKLSGIETLLMGAQRLQLDSATGRVVQTQPRLYGPLFGHAGAHNDHRVFFVRGLMTFLKLGAAMAIMRVPALRARSNYDRRAEKTEAAPRKALPVVGAEVSP